MNQDNWKEIKAVFSEALELPASERAAFLDGVCGSDNELRSNVDSLLAADDEAGEFIIEPALVEAGLATDEASETSFAGQRIGAYQIVRELGRGGMGTVFLATRADAQFDKQVAIKIVKRGMDTELILRRFVMERQILANLEHPNIARFLDGGSTEDGLPYFVMEFVAGESIISYCDANKLNTRERLLLFQRVCAAVQHAHQNLIVHRDLKPSNILVTVDGTPKLLDFGVAKLLHPDWTGEATEETATALRLMTPEYASPEQLQGLPITTATDVYSLGIILYELLSGHRPFRFRSRLPEEIVRVLLTEEPERPSTAATRQPAVPETGTASSPQAVNRISRSLRGDVDNIVLKALRKDRERRYASVFEFSEDIRRHLGGLPVKARPDTFSYRATKFVQRHRASVAMAALMVVTLISATTVTSWQGYVARRERQKAERRFAEQRRLADSLITEVQTSLHDVPHTIPTQRLLAQKSLEYLNNLAKDAGNDPAFLGDLATAYANLGYFQSWTLQDNPNAMLSYQRAIDLCRKRAALEPNGVAAKRQLGDLLSNKIESLNFMNREEEASATYSEKISIEQDLLATDPRNPERMMWVAETTGGYAETLRGLKRLDEANAKFQAAVAMATQAINLFAPQAQQPTQRVDLSLWQLKQGSLYEKLGQFQRAAESYRDAANLAEAVHKEHPEIVQALRNTTSSHWYLGQLLDRQGDHQQALENYRVSLKTIMDATAVDPTVDPGRYGETKYNIVVGKALCRMGQKTEGAALLRHGVEILRSYLASDRGNTQSIIYGSEVLWWAVEGLAYGGLTDEAKRVCLDAIKLVEQSAKMSADPNPWLRLISWYELLGDVSASYDTDRQTIETTDRPRLLEARRSYQRALEILRDSTEKFKISTTNLQDRMVALQGKLAKCDAHLSHSK